jgi:ribose transport system permease protein
MSNHADVVSDLARSLSARSKSVRIPAFSEFSWIWVGLIVLFSVSSVVAPGTITRGSILAMLPFAGILAIVATGQTLVIQQRGLDMSAIGMVSLAGVVMARSGFGLDSIVLGVIVTVCVGAMVGIVNGTLVSKFAITPLVATLAVNALLIGGVRSLTGNVPVNVPTIMQTISHAHCPPMCCSPSLSWSRRGSSPVKLR